MIFSTISCHGWSSTNHGSYSYIHASAGSVFMALLSSIHGVCSDEPMDYLILNNRPTNSATATTFRLVAYYCVAT